MPKNRFKTLRGLVVMLCATLPTFVQAADAPTPTGLRLPAIFSDNMVLQADMKVPVWGWANPGETVTVSVAGQNVTAKADEKGKWKAVLSPMQSAEHLTFTAKGSSSTLTVNNVLVGEVWFASGQSNMARSQGKDDEQTGTKKTIPTDPQLRLFTAKEKKLSHEPQEDLFKADKGGWMIADAKSVPSFSAAGYYFGRDLRAATKRPVGIIVSAIGGVPAQTFVSREVLSANPELKPLLESSDKTFQKMNAQGAGDDKNEAALLKKDEADLDQATKDGKTPPSQPIRPKAVFNIGSATIAYNSQVAPLIPYAIKGVIWYQGESNNAKDYRTLFPALINSWRKEWGQGDFPFLFVQITYQDALFRELQQQITKTIPNTAMVVISELGMRGDPAHPPNKEPTGERLAFAARALAYGEKLEYYGPVYESVKFNGSKAIVSFSHLGGGLAARDGTLKGFQLAGADKKFAVAKAEIVGETVVVTSEQVSAPVAVRYGFLERPSREEIIANGGRNDALASAKYCPAPWLINKDGLTAGPFRSDSWPVR